LTSTQRTVGVLGLGPKLDKGIFTDAEIEYLSSLGNLAATSIENALMYQKLESVNRKLDKKIQELNTLFDIGKELNSTLDKEKIINLLMFPVIWVETIRSFGRNSLLDTWLAILTLGFYIYYVNYGLDAEHIKDRSLHPKTGIGEWVSSNSNTFWAHKPSSILTFFISKFVVDGSRSRYIIETVRYPF